MKSKCVDCQKPLADMNPNDRCYVHHEKWYLEQLEEFDRAALMNGSPAWKDWIKNAQKPPVTEV